MGRKRRSALLARLLLVPVALFTIAGAPRAPQAGAQTNPFPHVQGNQLIGPSGQPFLLRGAVIESSLIYENSWQKNNNVTSKLNSAVFTAMSGSWHMNVVRVPISNWIYASNPTYYLSLLDQVIQEASQAGLYVILNLHDDQQSGSPYGSGAQVPKPESVAFWQAIAARYASNPIVMYDIYNEPQYPDATTWLNGGGTIAGSTGLSTSIVGMQALVNAIRATGSQQIIIIEGITTAGNLRIDDPEIVYSSHDYHEVAAGTPTTWSAKWGGLLGNYPLYDGEWALLPNAAYAYQCQGATQANADQKVIDYMNFLDQFHISWTAWQFDTYRLIQDHTSFTPTRLNDPTNPWVCNTPNSTAGMGTLVQEHLQSLALGGGKLLESANFSGATAGVTLNGRDQTASYTLAVTVSDTRTSAAGWHLTITSSRFSAGGGAYKLSPNASNIVAVAVACNADSDCTYPANGITYPLPVPAGGSQPAIDFYQAMPYSGIGTFTVVPTISVLVPANTYAGKYTSTVTLAVISGP